MISQVLTSNNVWYIAAASVVLLAMWMGFMSLQGEDAIDGPDQGVDLSTPAGRRTARQRRALERGHARDNTSAEAASAAVPVKYSTTSFAVETSTMDVTVTVVRPVDPQITILTLHDPSKSVPPPSKSACGIDVDCFFAASDHRTAFNYFVKHVQTQLSSARVQVCMLQTRVYAMQPFTLTAQFVHVDLPGFEAETGSLRISAPPLPKQHQLSRVVSDSPVASMVQQVLAAEGSQRRGSGALPSGPARGMPKSLNDIAAGVTQVMAAFGVQNCVGLGVGAGGTVLSMVSRSQMSAFSVLILCNPLALSGPTWQEKLQWRSINSLFALGFLDWAAGALRDVALGPSTRQGYVGQEFKAAAAKLSAPAVRGYIEAALGRGPLDTAALSEVWRRTHIRLLGFSGEAACGPVTPYSHMGQTAALLQAMRCADASICSWEELPYAGACCTVDEPKRLLAALRMALYAMGYAS